MKNTTEKILYFCLIFSFLSHFFVFIFFHNGRDLERKGQRKERIDFVLLEEKKSFHTKKLRPLKKKRQVVEQESHSLNSLIPEKKYYLGRFNQKVKEEMKASQTGRFLEAPLNLSKQKSRGKNAFSQFRGEGGKKDLKLKNLNPRFSFHRIREKTDSVFKDSSLEVTSSRKISSNLHSLSSFSPVSQTSDHLKNVKQGTRTLLNSREFMYYFFYQRLREKLLFYWEGELHEKMISDLSQVKNLNLKGNYTTKVKATLDKKGSLVSVQVLEKSGIQDLDSAAVKAFQEAGPFLNPPRGMEDGKGRILIRWDFVLKIS